MKKLVAIILSLGFASNVFAQTSFSGKIALIRQRHPNVSAVQLADVAQIFSRMEVNKAFNAPAVIDTGVDYSQAQTSGQTNDSDGQGTHVAGIVGSSEANTEVSAVRSIHPELSDSEVADIINILK